jgi:GNAT superfamily N-acetyltransferase
MIRYVTDPFPSDDALRPLRRSAWGDEGPASWRPVLDRSLAHVAAYNGDELVGFVNVAWDGGQHAFILDTSVHRDWQRRGIATRLVAEAAAAARERGASWLHVDFDPHLEGFYRGCGFTPTPAGLIRLA